MPRATFHGRKIESRGGIPLSSVEQVAAAGERSSSRLTPPAASETKMDDESRARKIGAVAGTLVQQVMELGLTWDEAVAAFRLAAKAAAQAAVSAGEHTNEDCVAIAREGLNEAFVQEVRVVVAISSPANVNGDTENNPLLAIAHRRHAGKLH